MPAFAPTDLTGLAVWLKADTYTQSDNTTAPTPWTDQSSGGHNASYAAGTVKYRTGRTPVGGPSFEFSGAGSTQQVAYSFASGAFSALTSVTLVIVVKSANTDNRGPWRMGGNDFSYDVGSDGTLYDGAFTASRVGFIPATSMITGFRRYAVTVSSGGAYTGYLENSSQVTMSTTFSAPTGVQYLGADTSNYGFNGEIAEFLLYNRVLTGTELGQVDAYLQLRHFGSSATGSITLGGSASGVASNPALGSITLGGAAAARGGGPSAGSITLGGAAVATANTVFFGWSADDTQQCLIETVCSAVLTVSVPVVAPPAGVAAVLIQGRHVVMGTLTLDANMQPVQPWTFTYA